MGHMRLKLQWFTAWMSINSCECEIRRQPRDQCGTELCQVIYWSSMMTGRFGVPGSAGSESPLAIVPAEYAGDEFMVAACTMVRQMRRAKLQI